MTSDWANLRTSRDAAWVEMRRFRFENYRKLCFAIL